MYFVSHLDVDIKMISKVILMIHRVYHIEQLQ